MMIPSMLGILLAAIGAADAPAAQPAARLLKVKGTVMVICPGRPSRIAAPLDTAYVGERLVVSANAELVLAFRGDGHLERVKPGSEINVGSQGCSPASAVEPVAAPEAHRRTVNRAVRQLKPEGPAAAIIVREQAPPDDTSAAPDQPAASRACVPIDGSVILTDRPTFAWPLANHVVGYKFHLFQDANEIWAVSVNEPPLKFGGESPLKPGIDYIWEVFAVAGEQSKERLASGLFSIANDEQKSSAQELVDLATGDDVAMITLAAAWLEENQLIAEATAAYERLVKLQPAGAAYWFALGQLYQQADRGQDAENAFQKAEKLRRTQRSPRPEFLDRLHK